MANLDGKLGYFIHNQREQIQQLMASYLFIFMDVLIKDQRFLSCRYVIGGSAECNCKICGKGRIQYSFNKIV
jgi:hypothetical protein